MPPFTALVHTQNDGTRLGRTLETLHPCDEILVVDHGSADDTLRVAREYCATIRMAESGESPDSHLRHARHAWVLVVLPSETISEALEAALFEWKLRGERDVAGIGSYTIAVREETREGWSEPRTSTRLVPRQWQRWDQKLPQHDPNGVMLDGDLLRFRTP
jgi:glycosyltransferase involved in cell wall biosynthesis